MSLIDRTCIRCGKGFQTRSDYVVKRGVGNFCSKSCSSYHHKAGGKRWTMQRGYRMILLNGKFVREHRVVAEQMLGRPLHANEVVHHKNGVKDDNRPENLEVMTRGQHALEHVTPEVLRQRSIAYNAVAFADFPKTCVRPGCDRKPVSKGRCGAHYVADRRREGKVRSRNDPLKPKPCSHAGCSKHHYAKGLCENHYAVERRKAKGALDEDAMSTKVWRAQR